MAVSRWLCCWGFPTRECSAKAERGGRLEENQEILEKKSRKFLKSNPKSNMKSHKINQVLTTSDVCGARRGFDAI